MRTTYTTVKGLLARATGMCTADTRLLDLVNEAQERLLSRGKWRGSVVRYRICINSSCITWPRQLETIEAFAICETPGKIFNQWYEFVGNGPGQLDNETYWYTTMVDRGEACAFDDITGATKQIRVYADVAEAASQYIILQGYDENANWIRTLDGATWIDGEKVLISTTPQLTTKKFSSLTSAIKPVTNGVVRLYEYDTVTGVNTKALAFYESDETLPIYRRSLIPNLEDMGECSDSTATCENKQITVMAKLRHIPVRLDNDPLIIGNVSALKLMVMAIRKEEQNLWDEAQVYEAKAVAELETELRTYQGDGPIIVLRTEEPDVWGGGGIENSIGGWYR